MRVTMRAQETAGDRVLVINCGSSSIKFQFLAMDRGSLLTGGLLERIGEGDSRLRHRFRDPGGAMIEQEHAVAARDHREAFRHIDEALRGSNLLGDLTAIGHRVVHGGEAFSTPILIDPAVVESIRALCDLAPLHNPANLTGIEACREAFPDVPQVAVFDTAFHQTMPPHAYRYAVPEDWYARHGVRRYGFHGSSHRYVAERAAEYLGRPLTELNLITLHLGNGASAAAIERGQCVDTSMGFTPLEGLVMGTRCGDLDPSIPYYLQQLLGIGADGVDHILNHEAGLKGLCGSNDLRVVLARKARGDEAAELALTLYGYRIKKYIGAYSAALGRVDAMVFTGGVGENAAEVRALACRGLERLGIILDERRNRDQAGEVGEIGDAESPVRLLIVRTNEELQIARETLGAVRAALPLPPAPSLP